MPAKLTVWMGSPVDVGQTLPFGLRPLHFFGKSRAYPGRAGLERSFFRLPASLCLLPKRSNFIRAGRDLHFHATAVRNFFELEAQGAHNINLVTPTHFLPHIRQALTESKADGLRLPVIYNSSGYETPEALRMLEGLIDIYLPDFKYWSSTLAAAYSHAPDYPSHARAALAEMVRQTEAPAFDADGMMVRGTIVRHLLLPGCLEDAKAIVQYLYSTYGERIWISLMNQYTPILPERLPSELRRTVSRKNTTHWLIMRSQSVWKTALSRGWNGGGKLYPFL